MNVTTLAPLKLTRERHQNGSLTIEERSNGKVWIFRFREPLANGNTRQRKITIGPANKLSKAQAQKKAIEYRSQVEDPEPIQGVANLTVALLVEHYTKRELGDDSGKALKPRKAYLYIFNNYILPKWGSLPLRAVKAVAVEEWLKSLPLANGSKAKIREVFGTAFRHAIRHELYPTNPITSVRQSRKRATEPSILEPAEIAAILRELEGDDPINITRTAFLVAAVMGMRRGEVFGLQWQDVDFERAILHVRRSYVDGVVGPPKTDSSRRPLPVPPQVIEALKVWREKSSYTEPENGVFASDVSFGKQPYWPGTLWRRNVAPAIERTGIIKPGLGWHTLRRSYASLLLSSGASLRVSMELMRHSTAEMTLQTYAQIVGNEKREAGQRIAELVLDSEKAA